MDQADDTVKLYGTDEPGPVLRRITVGPLSFLYSHEGLRRISWHGTELVRALAWPIRDENWGTYPPELVEEIIDDSSDFEANLTLAVAGGRLTCRIRLRATASGNVEAGLVMTPQGAPFPTNRAGFTILHPIKGFAGAALDVVHADGTQEATVFPELIQPDQPVRHIAGLSYGLGTTRVEIALDGEVFEMEDQRNWSDASYKTYCVPLVAPFTYEIAAPTQQVIRMMFSGGAVAATARKGQGTVRFGASAGRTPDIGLAVQGDWLPEPSAPVPKVSHVLLRLSPDDDTLAELCAFAQDVPAVDLEVVLSDTRRIEDGLRDVAHALASRGILPRRVIALRNAYLGSHQPVGPWPEGPTPNETMDAVRVAFPDALVGGGMMTNFTELNRCRPDVTRCGFITHGLTPLVHAGDDLSVLETLETLPQIFASAEALAGGRPYRLGLASIGMRTNPYGAAVAGNPAQVRRTMAQIDPRHRGLFGAAYAVGVLAATADSAVEALCLAAPAGPFGVVFEGADHAQAGHDGSEKAVYPLFHVVRAASAMAGQARQRLEHLPDGVVGYGAERDGVHRAILANVSERPQRVVLDDTVNFLRLDTDSFDAATVSANWLDMAPRQRGTELGLPPFSVAFMESSAANGTDRTTRTGSGTS